MSSSLSRKPSSDDHPRPASSSLASRYHPYPGKRQLGNVTKLLSWREVSPVVRRPFRKLWGGPARCNSNASCLPHGATSPKQALVSWVEAEALKHCTGEYCPLQPAPRSTIAAAFSPDGTILASTHGDHTVKLICCKTGLCLKTLCGHRRTPWVVRFHPTRSDILASGSLDNEVKIWDANTAECIASHDFHRPIASIAFHAQGNLLAVASGHKLYIWQYNREREESIPPGIVLRTRRSLRAVHFHPHAAPLLLTAEVNGLDAPDHPMALATSPGYIQYPRPAIFLTPVQPSPSEVRQSGDTPMENIDFALPASSWIWPAAWLSDAAAEADTMMDFNGANPAPAAQVETNPADRINETSEPVPMDISPRPSQNDIPSGLVEANMETGVDMLLRAAEGQAPDDLANTRNITTTENNLQSMSRVMPRSETRDSLLGVSVPTNLPEGQIDGASLWPSSGAWANMNVQLLLGDNNVPSILQQQNHTGEPPGWELPFLQGWFMGQTQGLLPTTLHSPQHGILVVPSFSLQQTPHGQNNVTPSPVLSIPSTRNIVRSSSSRGNRGPGTTNRGATSGPGGTSSVHVGILHGFASRDPNLGMIATETSPQLSMAAAAAAAELPCTVKLRLWPHDIKDPSVVLDPETCFTIPHAVLCSEMGAHFSPCGRFLAACVACVLPPSDSDNPHHLRPSLLDTSSAGTSPTRHSISAQQVIYELRIYSLEEATFGQVLASRAIRAAHCLTSIQFSPASDHILLAYGRRHGSLLRSIIVNGTTTIPIFTILEVYRVSDMELVKVLPSAEDEVNVACFHPTVGGGLAYGTKEGRLRIFRHDRSDKTSGYSRAFEDHLFDVG